MVRYLQQFTQYGGLMDPKNPNNKTVSPDGRVMDVQPRWRKDFPIDTELDGYVSRRNFTRFITLISFAFVAGQIWILLQIPFGKRAVLCR